MTKYLILLLLIAGLAGYAVYDMTPATKEVAVQKDRHIDSWGQTLEQATTTIEKNESTKFTKTFTDRPPQEEEVQEQAKTAPEPEKKVENDIPPMPPELNPGQEKNWEALQRHKQQESQAEEPELDGGPPVEAPPPPVPEPAPPVPYGQYPCSYPDCPGNPDVEDYLGKRWRWEGGGPQWYGSGGPNGVDVQAPFFQLHIRPWKGEWRRHWRNERRERW